MVPVLNSIIRIIKTYELINFQVLYLDAQLLSCDNILMLYTVRKYNSSQFKEVGLPNFLLKLPTNFGQRIQKPNIIFLSYSK